MPALPSKLCALSPRMCVVAPAKTKVSALESAHRMRLIFLYQHGKMDQPLFRAHQLSELSPKNIIDAADYIQTNCRNPGTLCSTSDVAQLCEQNAKVLGLESPCDLVKSFINDPGECAALVPDMAGPSHTDMTEMTDSVSGLGVLAGTKHIACPNVRKFRDFHHNVGEIYRTQTDLPLAAPPLSPLTTDVAMTEDLEMVAHITIMIFYNLSFYS